MDDEDSGPPKLTIAASNSDEEIVRERARERCLWHIDYYTRELAANVIE